MSRSKPGVRPIHSRTCASRQGRRCNCRPTWQADVRIAPGPKGRLRRNFSSEAEASGWRIDTLAAKRKGAAVLPSEQPLAEAAEALLDGMRSGMIRNRSRSTYKPSTIRSYEESLRLHVVAEIGALPVGAISRPTLQRLVDKMQAGGKSPSTIRNAINPLKVLFSRLARDGHVSAIPTTGLDLPAVRTITPRSVAAPDLSLGMIDALPRLEDQALWATAFLAGLRRGELMALTWTDVDLDRGLIHVERSWDREAGVIDPKSTAGFRDVPIIPALRERLIAWKLACPWSSEGLVVGRSENTPFEPARVAARAKTAWKRASLSPLSLHEARHTYASMLIAAGTEPRTIMALMGHASITVTFNRYGHLFPGTETLTGQQLQAYIDAETSARQPPDAESEPAS